MEKIQFKISIDASREKLWNILWNDDTYPQWTSVFSEGSRAETDWKKGSKVLFLNVDNDGMVSTIVDLVPDEFMSFKHIGTVNKGIENTAVDQTKGWSDAMENYSLQSAGGETDLTVDMDIVPEYKDYFEKTWPQALNKLKELAER